MNVSYRAPNLPGRMSDSGRQRCDCSDRFEAARGHDRTLANGGFAAT